MDERRRGGRRPPGAVGRGGERPLVVLGSLTLPGVTRSVGRARRFLRDPVPAGHPRLDDLVTVGSETVTNAIVHTDSGDGGRVTIKLPAGEGVYRVEAADDGAGGRRPRLTAHSLRTRTGAETGRGLWLVEALSDDWGFRAYGLRTAVWAEFQADRNSSGNTDRGLSGCSSTLVPTAFEGGNR
ncbi:MAG TPA: ATP-binding protein [Spirillospora sp.]